MSLKRKCKSQNSISLQPSTILDDIKDILFKKYSCLSINKTISQDHVPFLHIWKPITKTEGVQGMPFLPCFHIIVTVTSQEESNQHDGCLQNLSENVSSLALFQLHSFHGKVIADESIAFENCNQDTNYDLIRRMAEDKIQICHGIEDVNKDKFTNFLASCELPLLGKIKSVFLIEQFMGEVVLRSRLCEFALYDEMYQGLPAIDSFSRCQECDAFQVDHKFSDPIINSGCMKSEQIYLPIDENISDSNADSTYERVFRETSVSDGEAMAVYDKAKYLYEISSNKNGTTTRSKRKTKRNTMAKILESTDKFKVKCEPCDSQKSEDTISNSQSHENHIVCDPTSSALLNNDISNKINEGNVLQSYGDLELNLLNKNNDDRSFVDGYQCKLEDGIDDALQNSIIGRKRKNKNTFSEEDNPDKSYNSRRKYKKKELTDEQKLSKLEKIEKRKIDAKKRLVTYSRTCSICSHTFTNITHFDQDQTRHSQALSDLNQPFSCPLCNVVVGNKFLVTQHFSNAHSDLNVSCCCECSQVIPNGNNRLRRHILKFHHSAEEKVVCPECGKESSGRTQLEIHLAQYHSDKKIAVCQTCGKGFGTMSHYQLHLRRHHQPRDLQCPHCDKKFESRDQAIKHLIVHTGIKPFKCIQCQYVSYRASNVYCVHYEKSHGRKGNNDDVITDIVERDRMFEIARIEAEGMLQDRNSKLKKEPRSESIFMRTWGRKISTKPENQEQNC